MVHSKMELGVYDSTLLPFDNERVPVSCVKTKSSLQSVIASFLQG